MKTLSLPEVQPDNGRSAKSSLGEGQKRQGVFLVEDHPITQAGLAALIEREEDLFICGTAESAPEALDRISKVLPSLVITDIALKTSNGIELMKNLMVLCPEVPILVMSMHDESLYAERAIRAGARGYLMKREATESLLPAIRALLNGHIYLSEEMKGKLLSGIVGGRKIETTAFPLDTLSDRELEVFQLIGNGFTTREIAQRLNLSTKTIDSYREHLKAKLDLKSGSELVRRAIRWTRFENIVEN